jgi:hypothetical protein
MKLPDTRPTILTGLTSSQTGTVIVPQVAQFGATTSSGNVATASGRVATVTIDTTGFGLGDTTSWAFQLNPTLAGQTSFPGTQTTVTNGTITIDGAAPFVANLDPPDQASIPTTPFNLDVTFSETVSGVDASDLVLSGAAGGTVGTPTELANNTWRFPISNLTDGVLRLSLAPDMDDIEDVVGNDLANTQWAYAVGTAVNEPPTLILQNTTTTLAEDTSTTARVEVADIVVSDDGLGTNALSLSGNDAALFEIDGTVLYLKAGASLDFETNPQLDVTVAVDDTTVGTTPDDTAALAITVTEASSSVTLQGTASNNTIVVTIGSTTLGTDHIVTIDGTEHRYNATAVTEINIDGLAGTDTITVHGKATSETAAFNLKDIHVSESGVYDVYGTDVENIYVYSNGGSDTATMAGSTVGDTLWGRETYAKMKDAAGTAYYHYAQDFDQVTANGGGGDDSAYLYGSSGNDTFN